MNHELFQVNLQLEIPIYQQLADRIRTAAKSGKLAPGYQLPTVRDLAESLTIAPGTIKRAYDELERQGIVEKIRGRGTFIRSQQVDPESHKDQAMEAIEECLDRLEALGFPPAQIHIFLDLKLRERSREQDAMKIAVVDCNPEVVSQLVEQLRPLPGVELYAHLLSDVLAYPYKLSEDMDLVVTTGTHASQLSAMLPDNKKLAKVALRPMPGSLAQLLRVPAGSRLGILCQSEKFCQMVQGICPSYGVDGQMEPPLFLGGQKGDATMPHLSGPTPGLSGYLSRCDVLLVPGGYDRFLDRASLSLIEKFSRSHPLIACTYGMDEGSLMFLQDRIEKMKATS